jgi:hypothetical protein
MTTVEAKVELSEEQKQENLKVRDRFAEWKKGTLTSIQQHKNQISELEEEIKDMRPILKDCTTKAVCNLCDIYSMKYNSDEIHDDGLHHVYNCLICGSRQSYT